MPSLWPVILDEKLPPPHIQKRIKMASSAFWYWKKSKAVPHFLKLHMCSATPNTFITVPCIYVLQSCILCGLHLSMKNAEWNTIVNFECKDEKGAFWCCCALYLVLQRQKVVNFVKTVPHILLNYVNNKNVMKGSRLQRWHWSVNLVFHWKKKVKRKKIIFSGFSSFSQYKYEKPNNFYIWDVSL